MKVGMEKHTIQTSAYEGPLDLLLSLIIKNEVDIYDIPIFEITEQYMQYIYCMNEMNIEVASEFIVMAAKLIEIKSKMLLPKSEDDEEQPDPREELMLRLLEYKLFKSLGEEIKCYEPSYQSILTREPFFFAETADNYSDIEINTMILTCAMRSVLAKRGIAQEASFDTYTLETERYTLEERTAQIIEQIELKGTLRFFALAEDCMTKKDLIVTFLAILELLKLNAITLLQTHNFDDIIITKAEI
jgi:segregation and condensation protein A